MDNEQGVTIRRLDVPFWHLVGFLIKLGIAAVPATIALAVIATVAVSFTTTALLDLGRDLRGTTSHVSQPIVSDACRAECKDVLYPQKCEYDCGAAIQAARPVSVAPPSRKPSFV